jgi:hypothetical protein
MHHLFISNLALSTSHFALLAAATSSVLAGSCEIRAAADTSRLLAAFARIRRLFSSLPLSMYHKLAAAPVLAAGTYGDKIREFINFNVWCNSRLSTFNKGWTAN